MDPKVDFYFTKAKKWHEELKSLRTIVLDCGLIEELKWGVPCYTYQKANVVLIHTFKEYCAILFVRGALLDDTDGILIQQTENTQAARQIRFTCIQDINERTAVIKAFLYEAIEVEKAGLEVEMKETSEFEMPDEFQKLMKVNSKLRAAFEKLTPGRQRGYLLYFSNAKQSKTRTSRVEKSIPQILDGKGLNDD